MTFAHVLPLEDEPAHRQSPHNIEVEQALLGAILINNEAFFRVSDFLEPVHFYDPLHRQTFETAGQLIRLGKVADPRTIKSFLKENEKVGEITVAEYLARLAYEATTIINAQDYGRTIYDLALRRSLVTIGEDMVNIAYDAPVDMAPREQIEDAERRLFELAETGRFNSGFQGFAEALKTAIDMAGAAYKRSGHLSGLATGLDDLDRLMGGLQNSDLIILAGRPAWASRRSPPISATTSPGHGAASRSRTAPSRPSTAASWASSRWKCPPSSLPPACWRSSPAFHPPISAAAPSPRKASTGSSRRRRRCSAFPSTSTRPAASRSDNWRRARAG